MSGARAVIVAVLVTAAAGGAVLSFTGGGGGGDTANLWVSLTSCDSTPTRESTPVTFAGAPASAVACTPDQADDAASCSDTIRVKAGAYGPSVSLGGTTCTNTTRKVFIGEDGAKVDCGDCIDAGSHDGGLGVEGNVTVTNIDVDGDMPFMYFFRSNNTWQQSSLMESAPDGASARRCGVGAPEPVLVLSVPASDPEYTNNAILNNVFEPQHRYSTYPANGCDAGDQQYHLERLRIDGDVNGLTVCGVWFKDGSMDNTSNIFITTTAPGADEPQNLLFCNNVLGSTDAFNSIAVHQNVTNCNNWTWAYNVFTQGLDTATSTCEGADWNDNLWVGNVGSQTSGNECAGTHRDNVWQGLAAKGCDASDLWVNGANNSLSEMVLAASTYIPQSGSPAINNGETPGASDSCTDSAVLNSVDFDGTVRPFGGSGNCDAGPHEVG